MAGWVTMFVTQKKSWSNYFLVAVHRQTKRVFQRPWASVMIGPAICQHAFGRQLPGPGRGRDHDGMVFNAVLTRAFERRLPGPGTMTIRIGLRRNVRHNTVLIHPTPSPFRPETV